MKREIKDMSKDEINDFLSNQKIGVLSLSENDSSYSIPLAYSYDGENIYLTLGPQGRKMECIQKNKNVCFVVYHQPPSTAGGMPEWKSIICNGVIERITDPESIEKAVRSGEKHMGMPEGTWNGLLEKTLQAPEASCFWKVKIAEINGKQT
jgi:nitroimidazol reductase NimA-like FMN-containing flavoprotein (pyridoxamine 5'-phosphate oxidase superfamily)